MKRAVITKCAQLEEKLSGLVGMMNFRYLNLCIKAEEASLIPVKVMIEGQQQNLEDVAVTAKKDEYRFIIVPKWEDDMQPIAQAIAQTHPEFEQSYDTMQVDMPNEYREIVTRDVRYLLLTMPEVNDDRRDALKDTTDAINEYTKQQIDVAYTKTVTQVTELLVGEKPEDIDKIKDSLEQLKKATDGQRDKLHADKLKEINDAYKKWLASYAQQEVFAMEEEDSKGEGVTTSMRFGDSD